MRSKFLLIALGSALARRAPRRGHARPRASRRSMCRSSPRADYVFDAAAPGGALAPGEAARLDGWFRGLGLGYGDTVYRRRHRTRARLATQVARRRRPIWHAGLRRRAGHGRAQSSPARVRVVVSRTPRRSARTARTGAGRSQPNFNNQQHVQLRLRGELEHRGAGRQSGGPAPRPRRPRRRRCRDRDARPSIFTARPRRRARRACRTSARREASDERSVPGTRGSARSVHGLRLRRCDGRHAAAGRGRARLVAGKGQQGRPSQRRPVAVGLGEPEHPVRRPVGSRPIR